MEHRQRHEFELEDNERPCVTAHPRKRGDITPPCVSLHYVDFGHRPEQPQASGFSIQFRPSHIPAIEELLEELKKLKVAEAGGNGYANFEKKWPKDAEPARG